MVFFIVSVVLSFMCFYCAVLSAVSLWRINLSLQYVMIANIKQKESIRFMSVEYLQLLHFYANRVQYVETNVRCNAMHNGGDTL